MGNSLAVGVISHVVVSGRSELLALRKKAMKKGDTHVDRESWETAQEAAVALPASLLSTLNKTK